MEKAPFRLLKPLVQTSGVVFASPHSGRDYPGSFLRRSRLDVQTLRSSEDAFVDMLFGDAPSFGSPLLAANAPRAFIDLNRSDDELDPALIADVREGIKNPRVISGLGVIPRVVTNGRAIYPGKITLREASARIEKFWRPYHHCLQEILCDARERFGEAILIDCHSMPHAAVEGIGGGAPRPEIVLGDRFGTTARQDLVDRVEAAFSGAGLRVMRNTPFAGAYTAKRYGQPSRSQHVIQIEIDRSLYMNEQGVTPNRRLEEFRKLLSGITAKLVLIGSQDAKISAE